MDDEPTASHGSPRWRGSWLIALPYGVIIVVAVLPVPTMLKGAAILTVLTVKSSYASRHLWTSRWNRVRVLLTPRNRLAWWILWPELVLVSLPLWITLGVIDQASGAGG